MILDGIEYIALEEMAPLFGVTAEQVRALPVVDGRIELPKAWLQNGRRCVKECAAATGRSDLDGVLAYWRERITT